jgi:tRNA(Ser,Leu) C12 N-acetylase TAN1
MKDWNVVVTIYQDGFRRAIHALGALGIVDRSPYHNVLVMAVADPVALLEAVERETESKPALYDTISRVAPAMQGFEFHSAGEFEEKAKSAVMEWLPRLGGRSFHVRLHRRGFKHNLRTPDAERFLDDALLEALKTAGTPGSISFSDPDIVIAIDTIDDRAGIALWSREELAHHRLARPD